MREKLQKDYVEKMKELVGGGDPEVEHGKADDLLCELLEKLGYKEIVAVYNKVEKWYA